jgi:membrane protease YdiL (CAAX protease family)
MVRNTSSPYDTYKEMVSQYTKVDGILAIMLYIVLMLIYYLAGIIYVRKQLYIGVPVNIFIILLCIVLVLLRKQKLASIGFTLKNIGKALLTGIILGLVFSFFMNVLPNIHAGGKIISLNQALYNVFYYFIIISLSEEVVFRGYIQTRMYSLIKHDLLAVLVTGFLFYTMHIPFQMLVNGMHLDLMDLYVKIAMHFLMNYLYRKYNSLAGATVFHGLLDWGGHLIR